MPTTRVRPLDGAIVRIARRSKCIPKARLSRRQRSSLEYPLNDPDLYGVLVPPLPKYAEPTPVSWEWASVIESLRKPRTLPVFPQPRCGISRDAAVAALVLDGILEIEQSDGFVSGAAAYGQLFDTGPSETGNGRCAVLSIQAVRYGERLAIDDVHRLAARLYRYNCAPASPRLHGRFPSTHAVLDHLLAPVGASRLLALGSEWSVGAPDSNSGQWIVWNRVGAPPRQTPSDVRFKLYVSPTVDSVGGALETIARALADTDARALKVARTLYGLLRPDKLVAYFPTHASLLKAARAVRHALHGVTPQGVPFTASLTPDGLLSWGVDPVHAGRIASVERRRSWRGWVTRRLALALRRATSDGTPDVHPWKFALARLSLDGIDDETFAPTGPDWRGVTVI